jgi:TonB-dependent receptor
MPATNPRVEPTNRTVSACPAAAMPARQITNSGRENVKRTTTSVLRTALLTSAGIATALTAVPAFADDSMETIVVTGIRGSLQRNLDIKRESLGLVDAITMEDIGKFPDANLAQALMRVPGVTTSYTSNATNNGQSTTTGTGVSITVRGFGPSFNDTLFDGRVVPSGVGGRSFDFSGLSADMVSQLQVLKSPDASLSAGAIGATINVVYPKPFDKPGLTVAASASGDINLNDGRWKPNGNFLVSDTFDNDKVGVLVAGAYSSLSTSQWQVQNWGWIGQYIAPCQMASWTGADCNSLAPTITNYSIPAGGSITVGGVTLNSLTSAAGSSTVAIGTGTATLSAGPGSVTNVSVSTPNPATLADTSHPIWWTQDYAVDWNQIQEERINLRGVFQFRPTEALEITIDGNFARDDLMQDSLTYALWNNVGEMRKVQTAADGTITNFTRFGPQDFDDVKSQQILQTYSIGFNAKWNVNSHVTMIADYNQVLASLNPGDREHFSEVSMGIGYGPSQAGGTNGSNYSVVQPGGHALPYYTGIGPNGNASQFLGYNVGSDGIMGSHVMMMITNQNRYLVNQAKLESDIEYDNLKLKIGGEYTPEHYNQAQYVDHWDTNNLWQAFSGYGPDSNNYIGGNPLAPAGVHLPASLFHGYKTPGEIPGWTAPSGGVIPGLPILDAYEVINYINSLGTSVTCTGGVASIKGYNCGGPYDPSRYHGMSPKNTLDFDNSGYQKLDEDNFSIYASLATETKVADMPLKVNAGVRWEYTDVTATGLGQEPVAMAVSPADHTAFQFTWKSGSVSKKNAYSYLLPNVDINLLVTDDLHLRFDASRTMTRPPMGDLRGNLNYGGRVGSLSVSGGNPYELPYLSDNVDVGAEWYYATNSYLSFDTFLKQVSNWVVAGTTPLTLANVIDPTTGKPAVFTLQANANGPSANIYGIEMAWQHVFGDSGFGYLLNATIVGTNKPYDPTNLAVGNFGMPGLADAANATVFYDKDGIELRLAINWRDTYLDRFGQGQSGGTQFGSEPIFVNGNWDFTVSGGYDITDNIKAYFTVSNLLDNAYSTRGRFPDQVYSVITLGRSITAGVHYKL